jgi:uncharacterized membrane protein
MTNPLLRDVPIPESKLDTGTTNQVNALIHLYRAEVGKMTAYRVRLDTTTNWAISSSAVVVTLAIGNPGVPHTVFLFLMVLILFFLNIEARRFQVYEASRYRVLLMERNFYLWIFGEPVAREWPRYLREALLNPGLTVNTAGAIGWRLRRNYVWIYGVVLVSWLARLDLGGVADQNLATVLDRASVGSVPGVAVALVVAAVYLGLLALSIWAVRIYPMGDEAALQTMEETDG